MGWLLKLIGLDPVGKIIDGLNKAHEDTLSAKNDHERVAAELTEKKLQAKLDSLKENAGLIREGMSHKLFWIPWLLAAVPVSLWFGWGMLDSLCNGALPDVATLPPQLKEYADIVWQNLFYTGLGGMAVEAIAKRGR